MNLKIINLVLTYTIILVHPLESKIKDIQISFRKEEAISLRGQKHNNYVYPDKIIKAASSQEILKRIKRTSTLLKNKDPQTPIDPLQIIHPVTKPECGHYLNTKAILCKVYKDYTCS